jgi:chemotaxis protein MotB
MTPNPLSVKAADEPAQSLFGDIAHRLDEDEGIHRRGSPPWIITFADMITLLLAFFVLLLSFSDLNVTRFRDVSGSLQQSLGKEEALPLVVAPPAETQLAAGPALAAVPLPEQLAKDLGTLQKVMSTDLVGQKINVRVEDGHLLLELPKRGANGVISQEMLDLYAKITEAQSKVETLIEVREGRDAPERLNETAQRLQQLRTELAKEIAEGKAQVERDGERIVVRMLVEGSFYSGSADLSPDFFPLLTKIGRGIAGGPGRITIEGHTDSIPVTGNNRYRSNWDLSGARAGAVADYLIQHGGVARERIVVRGLADVKPLAPNTTREGRAKTRRIEVLVDAFTVS